MKIPVRALPIKFGTVAFGLLILLFVARGSSAQGSSSTGADRLKAAQAAFDAGRWQEAADLAQGPPDQSTDLDFLEGLAQAKLEHWDKARHAFAAGHQKAQGDSRFLVELAGIDYKLHDFAAAKRRLRAALRLNPGDNYTREFLGTLYFLDGNLEAALRYWSRLEKPRLRTVSVTPPPRLDEELLRRALGFNPPQVLSEDMWLGAEARLDNLEIFPHRRLELIPAPGGVYDASLRMVEQGGWGDSKLASIVSLFSGVPYETVYPDFYNLGQQAINVTSLLRWDSQKRRASAELSSPLLHDPSLRLRFYVDTRNENWNLTNTFFGNGPPLSDLNLRRVAGGTELRSVVNGRWSWSTGLEFANRSFRNLNEPLPETAQKFFENGNTFDYWIRIDRSLWRLPERRFILHSSGDAHIGRDFAAGSGTLETLRGSLTAHWFPPAKGDDYEVRMQLHAGRTFGQVPFDELFELGVERDNDLWLRGEAGTTDGRKGAAFLGRRYFLENWEMDKDIYRAGFLTIKLGPFLDGGAVADPSGLFGSRRWLWDTGAQCKVRVIGNLTVVFLYGIDLRGGRAVFYGTVLH